MVWVGRDDNAPMQGVNGQGVTGGRVPAVIWREIMSRVLPPRYVAPVIAPIIDPELSRDPTRDPIAEILGSSG